MTTNNNGLLLLHLVLQVPLLLLAKVLVKVLVNPGRHQLLALVGLSYQPSFFSIN